jgi:hypothetical protein
MSLPQFKWNLSQKTFDKKSYSPEEYRSYECRLEEYEKLSTGRKSCRRMAK